MAGNTATLTLKILADVKDAQKGLADAEGASGKFSAGVKGAAVPAAAALAGLAAAGLDMASAAAEDQAAADQLALALRNSAGASDASIAATEDWITKTSKAAAVADDELRPALGTLVRATGDVGSAQDLMNTALDVSAATGKDVGSVSESLAKAYAGNTTSLKKLVPGIDDAVIASGDMNAIMDELARTTGGAAATAADSAAGRMEGMKIQMGEAKEAIGAALLPALTSLTDALAGVAGWIQDNSKLFLIIGGIIGGFAAGILVLNAALKVYAIASKAIQIATKAWAAVQWILNSALLANPITLIVLAVIALIAVIVLIATKTTWFQDIWTAVWGGIKAAAEAVWSWLKGAAEAAIDFVAGLWQGLQGAVQAVWDWIRNAIQVVLNVVRALIVGYINIYIAIWNGIMAAVGAVWDWIKNAVNVALQWIVGIIRGDIATIIGIWEGIKSAVGAVWDWLKTTAQNTMDAVLKPVQAVEKAFNKVVDAIRSVINWLGNIKMPDVLGKIGSALDSINPFSASAASAGTVSAVNRAATFAAPGLSSRASSNTVAPTIVIQGALDPVGVARQIRNILKTDERRRSGVVLS
jgi:hypothetical protein